MTKAEKIHEALVKFATSETFFHQQKGVSDDIFQFLKNASEDSKHRLYDLMAVHTALAEVPQSDIADRLCEDMDPEIWDVAAYYNAERLEAAQHIDDLNLKIAELRVLLEKGE